MNDYRDSLLTSDIFIETKNRSRSIVPIDLVKNIFLLKDPKRSIGLAYRLTNLTETDKKILYTIKNLGPCYQWELKKIIGFRVQYYIFKLYRDSLLTLKDRKELLKNSVIVQVKEHGIEADKHFPHRIAQLNWLLKVQDGLNVQSLLVHVEGMPGWRSAEPRHRVLGGVGWRWLIYGRHI